MKPSLFWVVLMSKNFNHEDVKTHSVRRMVSGSHGGEYEDGCVQDLCDVQSGISSSTFQK
jgi:hypothetical protein